MACGLAVVGTDVPGIHEAIQHGVNGMLCAPTLDALAMTIGTLLSDADLRNRLGQEARRSIAERHSETSIVEKENQLIQTLLTGRRN